MMGPQSDLPPEPASNPQSLWFVIQDGKLLVEVTEGGKVAVPTLKAVTGLGPDFAHSHLLGVYEGRTCYACPATIRENPIRMEFHGLRRLYGALNDDLFAFALKASHIVEWDLGLVFCSACANPLVAGSDRLSKRCPRCEAVYFTRISPAVIVLVERGDRVLLARAQRFKEEIYSVIAGFVEPGETLEETVKREVKEETGIDVKDIRYFGSQPWPFPDSLMIGFTACYEGGEISIDEEEIQDARWFTADKLPPIPGRVSISRKLIDWFTAKHVLS